MSKIIEEPAPQQAVESSAILAYEAASPLIPVGRTGARPVSISDIVSSVQHRSVLKQYAQHYARMGLRVIPLSPNSDSARIDPEEASCDPKTVKRWWDDEPLCNVGLYADVKHNGDFREYWLSSSLVTENGKVWPYPDGRIRFGIVVAPPSILFGQTIFWKSPDMKMLNLHQVVDGRMI